MGLLLLLLQSMVINLANVKGEHGLRPMRCADFLSTATLLPEYALWLSCLVHVYYSLWNRDAVCVYVGRLTIITQHKKTRKWRVFLPPHLQICRNINRIKVCMEMGQTVILLNLENLYESLYDALNQVFSFLLIYVLI